MRQGTQYAGSPERQCTAEIRRAATSNAFAARNKRPHCPSESIRPFTTASRMSPAHLTALPPESLHNVCEILEATYRPSVRSFALACKQCHHTANAVLFRRIRLNVKSGGQRSQDDVRRWIAILEHRDSFRHVRQIHIKLEVSGIMAPDKNNVPTSDEIDTAWKPLIALIERLPALYDLIYSDPKRRRQLPPCLRAAAERTSGRLHCWITS